MDQSFANGVAAVPAGDAGRRSVRTATRHDPTRQVGGCGFMAKQRRRSGEAGVLVGRRKSDWRARGRRGRVARGTRVEAGWDSGGSCENDANAAYKLRWAEISHTRLHEIGPFVSDYSSSTPLVRRIRPEAMKSRRWFSRHATKTGWPASRTTGNRPWCSAPTLRMTGFRSAAGAHVDRGGPMSDQHRQAAGRSVSDEARPGDRHGGRARRGRAVRPSAGRMPLSPRARRRRPRRPSPRWRTRPARRRSPPAPPAAARGCGPPRGWRRARTRWGCRRSRRTRS